MDVKLKVDNLTHTYGVGTPFERAAITGISLDIYKGEMLGIIGRTGSGKSTLIQHLNGLLTPQSGRILLDGIDINSKEITLRDVRFRVGLVFQYPEYQLFEETVARDIAFGPKNMGLSESEVSERVIEAARFAALDESVLEKSPFELSGGQKRRAAIAGVIAMRPEVLILDEPTAGLDPKGRRKILDRIKQYHEESGATVVLVTHSMEDMARYAQRIAVMSDSGIVMTGAPSDIFGRAKELVSIGLDVPQVTKVMLRLRELGMPVDTTAYTVEDAARHILEVRRGA